MILFELTRSEAHPVYQRLEIENGNRHYDFLRSIVVASVEMGRPFLSQQILKALNFHAIACLHTHAGEFRPCPVKVGEYRPPEHYQVGPLMDDFINTVNRSWEKSDPVALATYVLWRLNYIHPFINGNGRTARAAAYFVLCVAAGNWLPGEVILPEKLRQSRDDYVEALKQADVQYEETGQPDLGPLHAIVSALLAQQLGVDEQNGNGAAEHAGAQEGEDVAADEAHAAASAEGRTSDNE
ncbi:Fic family protein [Rhizobium gallicum]|uniref:Fic family protein n=1 Tax=Rhizobium gallicum TaxID=56730 RepID=UPI001EF7D3DC|nr:Fic family protein [Rhizobium gallicum]ULJ74402.1 Fic family protein [Rhizobium gallicum]